ncbi:MAG: HdeD family acid-resistance protein [Pirellulales bacterium]
MLTPMSPSPSLVQEIEAMRHQWRWFLALGIAMVVLGTIAIGNAVLATLAATILFGFLLLAGGISQIVSAFWAGKWSGTLLHMLIGVLYVIVGFMVIDCPVTSAVQLTLIIAIFLLFSGIFRIIYALSERFTGWGWVLLNGAVSTLLGFLIYKQWPYSGPWVIGLFVGIDLIFNGWAWVMLSLGLRPTPTHGTTNTMSTT